MDNKICTVSNIEKHINNFYKKHSECKDCNIRRGVQRYYDNKDKILIQQKDYYEKKDKLLQKQNDYRNTQKGNKGSQTIKNYVDHMLN